MSWDFETPPDVAGRIAWAQAFIRDEVLPIDQIVRDPRNLRDPLHAQHIPRLQQTVRDAGMWAVHAPVEQGGTGAGAIEIALVNEQLGRTRCGPVIFGCQSPDAGNVEILARFGSPDIKARFLQPLVAGEMVSAFSVTEPRAEAPTRRRTRRLRSKTATSTCSTGTSG
ncbi:MAG: acyl-CoA dehydrogenase family protein [Ilumatobacteraceae bacterium]